MAERTWTQSLASFRTIVVELLKTPGGIVSLVGLVSGFGSLLAGQQELGAALLAAAFFAFLQETFQLDGSRLDPLSARFDQRLEAKAADIMQLHSHHWPTQEFPSGNHPNPAFNESVNSALRDVASFDFWGQSGWHHVKRLHDVAPTELQTVRCIVEDPRTDLIREKRYRERQQRIADGSLQGQPTSAGDFKQLLENRMAWLIVAMHLFAQDLQGRQIEMVLTDSPVEVRIEIAGDKSAFVSPSSAQARNQHVFPAVYRYTMSSVPGTLTRRLFNQYWQSSATAAKVRIDHRTTSTQVMTMLQELGLDQRRLTYAEYEAEVREELGHR